MSVDVVHLGVAVVGLVDYVDAQNMYCQKRGYKAVIPQTGICPKCGLPIFGNNGYDLYVAQSATIIGCPHCHTLFV